MIQPVQGSEKDWIRRQKVFRWAIGLRTRIVALTTILLLGALTALAVGETSPPDVKETIFIIEMEEPI